jgi:hypothetical protein
MSPVDRRLLWWQNECLCLTRAVSILRCRGLPFASTNASKERSVPPPGDARAAIANAADYFDREDDRFVNALRDVYDAPQLALLVDRWKVDPRPWAQQQVFNYLDRPLDTPGHHVVVKRLFKAAEERRDHEQMAAFLTAFDRLIRRERKMRYRHEYLRETRMWLTHETEHLSSPRDSILPPLPRKAVDPRTGRKIEIPPPRPYYVAGFRLFSYRTRRYLQRRAWRYFRRLGLQHPGEYVPAVAAALLRYVDDDFVRPENLLDSWGFVHACFGKHPAIEFSSRSASIKPGRSASELTAVPYFEPLWADAAAYPTLWRLLFDASSRAVRVWARQLLERHHSESLQRISADEVQRLLMHDDAELQQFGALLLGQLRGSDEWPVERWLKLLELRDPTALAIVCEQLAKHVSGDRLDAGQTIELATARATPVSLLGLKLLRGRSWDSPEDRRRLAALGNARCEAVAADLAKFALGVAGSGERYDRDVISVLFDGLLEPMRAAATAWFAGSAAAQDDPVLWSRLIETPYDDVRLPIVDLLQQRAARPRIAGRYDLSGLWSAVLLGVHRGGRQKLKAVDQLVDAMIDRSADHYDHYDLILVLATVVRSIRGPEQRAGLAGIARLIDRCPDFADFVRRSLPEISFTD